MESAPCGTQPPHHQPWEAGRCSCLALGNLSASRSRSWEENFQTEFWIIWSILEMLVWLPKCCTLGWVRTHSHRFLFFRRHVLILSISEMLFHTSLWWEMNLQWSWHWLPVTEQHCHSPFDLNWIWVLLIWHGWMVGHLKAEWNVLKRKLVMQFVQHLLFLFVVWTCWWSVPGLCRASVFAVLACVRFLVCGPAVQGGPDLAVHVVQEVT